jgi:hypothetical protein
MSAFSPNPRAYHRWPIRAINGLMRAVQPLGRARLDAEGLLADAQRATGLADFGDPRFREALQRLCLALEQQADMNPLGRWLTRVSMLRLLKHRLWAEQLFKQHPEILQREIKAPVVIVGLARSGTTRLHRLLAADPGFLHLSSWESVNPVPWPGSFAARERGEPDPRIASIEGALKAVLYLGPQIAAVHPLQAHAAEEELGLLQHAFSSQLFEIMAPIPAFAEWLAANDQTYAYEYMARLLRLVSWWRGDDPAGTWVLKTPQHMQDLDALLNVFPDARLLCPHRDPVKVVGSVCSTAWNALVRDSDVLDPHWVGADWLQKTERMLRKTDAIRAGLPAGQQLDILYENISRDWRGEMQRIYDFLGRDLSPQALTGMQDWLDSNSQHQHGSHKYALSDFGLEAAEVERRLHWYRERYAIPVESRNPHA